MPNMLYRTDEQIAAELRSRIGYSTTQTAIAKELGISKAFLSEVLAGKKAVGKKVLKALGYQPVPYYRRVGS